jgi:hypothetical protein
MSLINKKAFRDYMKAKGKQSTASALEAMEARATAIMRNAVILAPGNYRVSEVEIYHARG